MSVVVNGREVWKSEREMYRPRARVEVAAECPLDRRIERATRYVLGAAREHGYMWSLDGKKRCVTYREAGVPKWCHAAWLAGYDAATRDMAKHAKTVKATSNRTM